MSVARRCRLAALASLLLITSAAAFASAAALNVTLTLNAPSGVSTVFSPRRVIVAVNLTLSPGTVVIGGASVWLTSNNDAIVAGLRPQSWSSIGTYNAVSRVFSMTLQCVVETIDGAESKALSALSSIEVYFASVSRGARVMALSSSVTFAKLNIIHTSDTGRTRDDSGTFCNGAGGFLATMLKPYEQTAILATLSMTINYWVGDEASDARPANTYYCWKQDPDYDPTKCTSPSYWAMDGATNALGQECPRLAGFPCLPASYDFDGLTGFSLIVLRLDYASGWRMLDRVPGAAHLYGHVCTNIITYGAAAVSGTWRTNRTSKSWTRTATADGSATLSRSRASASGSRQETATRSAPTPSSSRSRTTQATETGSAPSPTVTRTAVRSRSGSQSEADSESRTRTRPPTRSRSRSRSRVPTLSRSLRGDKSASWTRSRMPLVSRSRTGATQTQTVSKRLTATSTPSVSASLWAAPRTLSASVSTSRSAVDDSRSRTGPPTQSLGRTPSASAELAVTAPVPALAGVTAFAVLSSVASGAAFIAVQQARLQSAIQLSHCGSGEGFGDDMEPLGNPLGLKFGSAAVLRSQRGAAFGNIFVVFLFAVFMLGCAAVIMWYTGRSFYDSCLRARLPGILVLPLAIVTPGSAEASATLWMYGPLFSDRSLAFFSSMTVVIGPLLLVLLVTAPGTCKARLVTLPPPAESDDDGDTTTADEIDLSMLDNAETQQRRRDERRAARNARRPVHWRIWSWVQAVYAWLLVPNQDWYDQDKPAPTVARQHAQLRADAGERGPFCLKYGACFEDFIQPLFAVVDLGVSVVIGFCAGVAVGKLSRAACLMWLTTATLCSAMHFLYLVRRRPCLSRLQQGYQTFSSGVTFVTVLFAQLLFMGRTLDVDTITSSLLDVQTIVSLVTALLQLISLFVVFFELYDAWKSGRDLHDRTLAQTFSLRDVLLEGEMAEVAHEADVAIDLSSFLDGVGEEAVVAPAEDIDLSSLLDEPDGAEQPAPLEVLLPTYALVEEDDGADESAGRYALFNDDDASGGDETRARVGTAHQANAAMARELASMMAGPLAQAETSRWADI